jgi:hypothetical protein
MGLVDHRPDDRGLAIARRQGLPSNRRHISRPQLATDNDPETVGPIAPEDRRHFIAPVVLPS